LILTEKKSYNKGQKNQAKRIRKEADERNEK
jgi:hypothetical protein